MPCGLKRGWKGTSVFGMQQSRHQCASIGIGRTGASRSSSADCAYEDTAERRARDRVLGKARDQ
eukprot:5901116-Pleurochrysis_carterae.AAC.4